jgi:hypothetical protein
LHQTSVPPSPRVLHRRHPSEPPRGRVGALGERVGEKRRDADEALAVEGAEVDGRGEIVFREHRVPLGTPGPQDRPAHGTRARRVDPTDLDLREAIHFRHAEIGGYQIDVSRAERSSRLAAVAKYRRCGRARRQRCSRARSLIWNHLRRGCKHRPLDGPAGAEDQQRLWGVAGSVIAGGPGRRAACAP